MRLKSLQAEESAGVQMAPLIDCVFMLLIFFLVTSMLSKPHNEIPLKVPFAGVGEKPTGKFDPLVIVVVPDDPRNPHSFYSIPQKKDAEYKAPKPKESTVEPFVSLENEVMTKDLLSERLRQVAQQTPNRIIRIDVGPGLVWRHMVPLLDLCRFHGLSNVQIRPF